MTVSPQTSSQPEPTDWRAHERGRVLHMIVDGGAACGEPGTRWRAVAGVARCPTCQAAGPDQLREAA